MTACANYSKNTAIKAFLSQVERSWYFISIPNRIRCY